LRLDPELYARIAAEAERTYRPVSTWLLDAALATLSIAEQQAGKTQARERKAQVVRAIKDKVLTVMRGAEGPLKTWQVIERGGMTDVSILAVIEALDELVGDGRVVKTPGLELGDAAYQVREEEIEEEIIDENAR